MNSSAASRASTPAHDQVEHLRLHGDVERGRRLVADQQGGVVGEGDRQHDALALAAGELVRVRPGGVGRVGQPDLRRAARRPLLARRAGRAGAVDQHRLGDLGADPHRRVERGHRLLEHHRDVAVRARADSGRVAGADQLEVDAGSRTEPVAVQALGQQADDAQRGQRLARARTRRSARPARPGRIGDRHVGDERRSPLTRDTQVADVEDRVLRRLRVARALIAGPPASGRTGRAARRRAG